MHYNPVATILVLYLLSFFFFLCPRSTVFRLWCKTLVQISCFSAILVFRTKGRVSGTLSVCVCVRVFFFFFIIVSLCLYICSFLFYLFFYSTGALLVIYIAKNGATVLSTHRGEGKHKHLWDTCIPLRTATDQSGALHWLCLFHYDLFLKKKIKKKQTFFSSQ